MYYYILKQIENLINIFQGVSIILPLFSDQFFRLLFRLGLETRLRVWLGQGIGQGYGWVKWSEDLAEQVICFWKHECLKGLKYSLKMQTCTVRVQPVDDSENEHDMNDRDDNNDDEG